MCKSSDGQDITTPFCKYRPQPIAGQKGWTLFNYPADGQMVDILAVADDSVMYRYQATGILGASTICHFLSNFKPPKPKPREIWVGPSSQMVYRTKETAPPYAIHYREVVEE